MKSSLCILLTFFLFSFAQASSSYHKTSQSQFTKHFLNSKKGDTIKGLNQVRQFFVKYGYLSPSIDKRDENSEILDHSLEEAIKKYQSFYHLDVSGVLDEKTLSLMGTPRCGCPDLVNGSPIKHGSYYSIGNTKWSKYNLTWTLKPGTRRDAIAPISGALARWASVSPFRFKNINNFDKAEVKIGFFRGAHGDATPFDGPGKVLAHGALPPYGFLHYDADEYWVNGAVPGGSDIKSIGLHEFGHVLGLMHSNDESSIMWAYMPAGITKDLTQDDVNGLKALYGFA